MVCMPGGTWYRCDQLGAIHLASQCVNFITDELALFCYQLLCHVIWPVKASQMYMQACR